MNNSQTTAWLNGFLGILIFSGSLPATRLAVGGFSPVFLTSARAAIAALLGGALLFVIRQSRPTKKEIVPLFIVSLGVVVGFPLLTALALQHTTAAHSTVFIGTLPLCTAFFGVVRGGERPKPVFWLFSLLGAGAVAFFALSKSEGGGLTGDLFMLGAILICGLGYAEGAKLSRHLGGWQVISWALVFSLPIMLVIALFTLPADWNIITAPAWLGLGYVATFSMLIGFIFWYRGLALGGITRISQLQLLQPFFGLMLSAALLGETVTWSMLVAAVVVVLCVFGARRFG